MGNENLIFEKYKNDRTIENRNAIVSKYLYLAEILSKKFANRGVEYQDLYQIASLALIKAVERYDLNRGIKFVSFATPTIVGEIKRYFRDKSSVIRIPRRLYELYQKTNQIKEELTHELERTPKPSEIAKKLKMPEDKVLEIIEFWNSYNVQSLDQTLFTDDNIEFGATVGEEDKTFSLIENSDFIEKSMKSLNDIERKFINLRYFNNKKQKEIADIMGVSQMYISRLEKKIISKLRKMYAR